MTLQALVLRAASVHLNRTAVCFDAGSSRPLVCHTYKTVLSEASELRDFLLTHCDFGGIREIGLYCQPGISVPSWILGILQVPAAYAPMDPDSPPSLSAHFMKKCHLKYVLVEKKQANLRACIFLCFEGDFENFTGDMVRCRRSVMEKRRTRVLFDITQEDVLFLASPLTFDPSVVEIFVSLSSGACLLIVPTYVKVFPAKLADVLFSRHRVTALQATPTLLRRFGCELIKSTVLSAHTSLRVLALGGEAFPSLAVLKSWREEGNKTQIFNIYGITEVSSWSTFYKIPEEVLNSPVKRESPVPLGSPLLGTVVEVRDTNGSLVHEGTGQVFLGGENRVCFLDGETAVPAGTMRATGDFVTVKDGEMFFLGRQDSQIKRHGKRLNIELVQQVAEELPPVESCAVTWYNQEKLILFVVAKADVVKDSIFKELRKRLPTHALPDDMVLIDALPFTCHGKVTKAESILSLPGDPEDAWKVPEDSVFLDSGGDSLKSTWLLNEIEKLTGTSMPGLLELILSRPILEVHNHIVQTLFAQEDLKVSKGCATKRKLSDTAPEEASGKPAQLEPALPFAHDSETNALIALSRGSQLLSLGTWGHLTKLGHCPSVCPPDFIPQTDTQVPKDLSPPVPEEKLKKPPFSQEGKPTAGAEMVLRERWRSDTGKCVDASPLLVMAAADPSSTTVYIGSHSHRVKAVDLYSGKTRWEQLLGDRIESSACVSKCGNFIVVGCYDGLVYVLKSKSGEKYWAFTTEDAVKSSPAVDPTTGRIYVGSHDQHAYALDIYVWRFSAGGPVFSSPCIPASEREILFGSHDCFLYCCSMEGRLQWKFETTARVYATPFAFSNQSCSSESLLAAASTDGKLWILEAQSGKLRSVHTLPGEVFSSPVVWGSMLIIGCRNNYVYCLDLLCSDNQV
ncbi:hypothetical protein U0070_016445 [Myodes glareolus]|uniref:Beta-alanine-activating enzyme n=1 Tax=Myodes glareolus TaxID=447135 RepID=A0AAW0JXY2_MYOGA